MSYDRAIKGMTFNEKLDFYTYPDPETGCWLWGGSVTGRDYGGVYNGHKIVLAHRASYERFNGPIPKGLNVCHKCDVPMCINPDHLFLGTQRDNLQDAARKGRMSCYHVGKLSDDQIIAIITDPRDSLVVAKEYGIHNSTVYRLRNGTYNRRGSKEIMEQCNGSI